MAYPRPLKGIGFCIGWKTRPVRISRARLSQYDIVVAVAREIDTVEKSVRIMFQGMFAKADRKLADKLRRQGRTSRATAAERRIELRQQSVMQGVKKNP